MIVPSDRKEWLRGLSESELDAVMRDPSREPDVWAQRFAVELSEDVCGLLAVVERYENALRQIEALGLAAGLKAIPTVAAAALAGTEESS